MLPDLRYRGVKKVSFRFNQKVISLCNKNMQNFKIVLHFRNSLLNHISFMPETKLYDLIHFTFINSPQDLITLILSGNVITCYGEWLQILYKNDAAVAHIEVETLPDRFWEASVFGLMYQKLSKLGCDI